MLMRIACVWPYQGPIKYIGRGIIILTNLFLLIPMCIRVIEEFYSDKQNKIVIFEGINGFAYFSAILTKYLNCILGEKKLKVIYEKITNDWEEFSGKTNELHILQQRAKIALIKSLVFIVLIHVGWLMYSTSEAVIPLVLDILSPEKVPRKRHLCLYVQYFIDEEKYFTHLMTYLVIAIYSTVIVGQSTDPTYVLCMEHLLGLFEIVGFRIKEALDKKFVDSGQSTEEKLTASLRKCVVSSVRLHHRSIELRIEVSSCILRNGYPLATQVRYVTFTMFMYYYEFFINWPGQKLIDSSSDLCLSIYSSNFHESPVKIQQDLVLMMQRCTHPCKLKAGPIIEMKVSTALAIVKAGLTFMTLLASLNRRPALQLP
ncbi:hypothetical protein QAD02_005421 [Eretmocerus hayati]|uniref:Uncharacterized protein n=1 Tax=Eretmocerus hayati TaxID=131215 RepID=A0ACC2NSU2_9HYME|nr:hypothetical protein QAD02_005421 [Eretmocerus hayati]